jgi:hypothetical protein
MSTTEPEFDRRFGRYKAFSDFLGFHARCYFCAFIGWYAISSETVDIAIAIERDQEYVANPFAFEVMAFLLMLAYSFIMYYYILTSVLDFWDKQTSITRRNVSGVLVVVVLYMEVLVFGAS